MISSILAIVFVLRLNDELVSDFYADFSLDMSKMHYFRNKFSKIAKHKLNI